MADLTFGLSSYERARGDLPELPVINMFVEEAPTEEKGIVLLSRPGLEETGVTLGAGPVQDVFQKDGVLSSERYAVSANTLYRVETPVGGLDGPGPFFMDGYSNRLFVTGGFSLWSYDGETLATIAVPDSAQVLKVIVGASRAIIIRADTEKFYWSDPLTATIDSLSFATAESQPDRLRDMLFLDDKLVLFGAETTEFWPSTQDANLPFAPLEGFVFEVGVKNTGAATTFGNTFAWVTNQDRVCVGDENTAISNEGMEARIKAATDCRLWSYFLDSIHMLALRLTFADGSGETHSYSTRSGRWSEQQSYGESNWIPQCFGGDVFGSSIDGRLLQFSDGWEDLGGVLERRIRAGFPINSGGVTVDNIILRANVGTTGFLTGDYLDPRVELRATRDLGRNWSAWKDRALGQQGEYRKPVVWRSLGMFGQPGALFELRCTDPVNLRISSLLANEPAIAGGR